MRHPVLYYVNEFFIKRLRSPKWEREEGVHTVAIESIFYYLGRSNLLFTAYKSDLRHLRWPKGRTDTERGGQTPRRGTTTKGRVYTEVSLNLLIKVDQLRFLQHVNKT